MGHIDLSISCKLCKAGDEKDIRLLHQCAVGAGQSATFPWRHRGGLVGRAKETDLSKLNIFRTVAEALIDCNVETARASMQKAIQTVTTTRAKVYAEQGDGQSIVQAGFGRVREIPFQFDR